VVRKDLDMVIYLISHHLPGDVCVICLIIRGPFEKFVNWRHCAAIMQREAVTVTQSYSGGGNVVVA
jgi:hypothetical protein